MAYRKDKDRLIYKFNGGRGALLCSNCYVVICEGKDLSDEIRNAIINDKQEEFGPVFCCEQCKKEWFDSK